VLWACPGPVALGDCLATFAFDEEGTHQLFHVGQRPKFAEFITPARKPLPNGRLLGLYDVILRHRMDAAVGLDAKVVAFTILADEHRLVSLHQENFVGHFSSLNGLTQFQALMFVL